ncbi:MAG: hypothetical protein ACYTBZ_06185 [Planctomycetota bacterium]|jgi:hypothetical protein
MVRKRIKLRLSPWDAETLLLLMVGALLWAFPEPDSYEEYVRITTQTSESSMIEEHNASSSQDVQELSDLDSHDLRKAASAVIAKLDEEFRDLIIRIYIAALAPLAAVCCWLAATLSLLARIRRGRRESVSRSATDLGEQIESPEPLEQGTPVPDEGRRLIAESS